MNSVAQLSLVGEHLVTKRQLAQYLGRSTRWVEMRVREGMPSESPTTRYPQRRFRLSDVEAWLAGGKPKPPPRGDSTANASSVARPITPRRPAK